MSAPPPPPPPHLNHPHHPPHPPHPPPPPPPPPHKKAPPVPVHHQNHKPVAQQPQQQHIFGRFWNFIHRAPPPAHHSTSHASHPPSPQSPPPPPPPPPVSECTVAPADIKIPNVVVKQRRVGQFQHASRDFGERIAEAEQTNMLCLSNTTSPVVWSRVATLNNLEVLDLRSMGLKRVPECVSDLVNLVELDVSENYLIVLPNLSKLKKLQRLRFTGTYLKQIPKSLTQCDSLIELEIEELYDWGWTFPPYKELIKLHNQKHHIRAIREVFYWMDNKQIGFKQIEKQEEPKEQEAQSVLIWGAGLTNIPDGHLSPAPMKLPKIPILQNSTVFQVACSGTHVIFLTDSGHVFTFGQGDSGQLGNGTFHAHSEPQYVSDLDAVKIVQVSCGTGFSTALSDVGDVYSWGFVPAPNSKPSSRPAIEESLKRLKITRIACGVLHVLALSNNGLLYSWGDPSYGRLGRPESDGSVGVIETLSNENIVDIACGEQHSCAVDRSGAIWTWGRNLFGQCGDFKADFLPKPMKVNSTEFYTKVRAGMRYTLALTRDGTVFQWGTMHDTSTSAFHSVHESSKPHKIGGALSQSKIYDISCGSTHCLALSEVGEVFAWGNSWLGQTGTGKNEFVAEPTSVQLRSNHAFRISAGGHVSLAVTGLLKSELGQNLIEAYNNLELFTDLEITVTYPHTNQMDTIRAHRAILAARSPVLRQKLLALVPGEPLNITTDKPLQLYEAFFRYLYSDQIDRANITSDMKELAIQYDVLRLAQICGGSTILITASQLGSQFASLITDTEFPGDLTILVEGQNVLTHKVFLCTRCKYFRAMLMGGMIESKQTSITLAEEVTHDSFMAVLHFIYSDTLPIAAPEEEAETHTNNTNNNNNNNNGNTKPQPVNEEPETDVNLALDAIPVANLFQMDRLKNMCESIVQKGISPDTVVYVWQMAKVYEAHQLRKFCLEVISEEIGEVKNSSYWETITDEEREELLQSVQSKRVKRV